MENLTIVEDKKNHIKKLKVIVEKMESAIIKAEKENDPDLRKKKYVAAEYGHRLQTAERNLNEYTK